jgi:hypothetical protein
VAIDPTAPLIPVVPPAPVGTAPDSVILQAVARQALANMTAQLSEMAGRPTAASAQGAGKGGVGVEQAGQAPPQDAGHGPEQAVARPPPQAQPAQAARPPHETLLVRAVRAAAAEAVPRQTGLAPLMANVGAVIDRPDTPPEVREAGRALIAQASSTAELTTAQGLRQAVERSGVLLEAHLARPAAAGPEAGFRSMGGDVDIKAALLVFRGALSAWLVSATPEPHPATIAPPVESSAPVAPEPEAPSLKPAASEPQAPLSRQASATGAPPLPPEEPPVAVSEAEAPPMAKAAPPRDGAASSVAVPSPSTPEDAVEPRFAGFVTPPRPVAAQPSPVRPALPALVQLSLLNETQIDATPTPIEPAPPVVRAYGAPSPDAERAKTPPPPYAGGPMAGQKPGAPSIPGDMPTLEVVRRVLKQTSGALARQDLMQIASLPSGHAGAEAGEARAQPAARLNWETPFATPQGVAVAQFEVSRDGGGAGGGAVGPVERTYRARFSIDVEPLGLVHALVILTGSRARVSLWAERAETIASLRAGEESLVAGLRDAALTPDVAVHSGSPPAVGVSPLGHFVDQAS